MQFETDPVEEALRLCGITSRDTIDAAKEEGGLLSLGDFGHLFTEKQVGTFVESLEYTGIHISYASTRKLRGLAFWVRKRGHHHNATQSLTADILDEACREMECSSHRLERMIPSHYKNVDFDIGLGWFKWKNRILHKLRTMSSAIGGNVTVHYVVRPGRRPPDRGPWNHEDYHMISLENQFFKADNKTVALFLADVLMDRTPMYYALVREALDNNNGRKAWLQLVEEAEREERAKQRYEHVSKRVAEVKYTGNEAEFPFHEYVANMRIYFDMLEENGKNYRFENFEKVFMLLDQIHLSQPALQGKIGNLRKDDSLKFEQCVEKLSVIIGEHKHLPTEEQQTSSGGTNRQRKRRRRSR